jgi:initiation factor 1A
MTKSNTIGGKHHKKGKKNKGHDLNKTDKLEYADQNQIYGIVKKKIGGSRLIVECSDGKERSGLIPGKFFKKIWMNIGDILLCDLNIGSDDTVCYISHKYTPKDANKLKQQGKITFDIRDDDENESSVTFNENDTVNTNKNNIFELNDIAYDSDDGELEDVFMTKNLNKQLTKSKVSNKKTISPPTPNTNLSIDVL